MFVLHSLVVRYAQWNRNTLVEELLSLSNSPKAMFPDPAKLRFLGMRRRLRDKYEKTFFGVGARVAVGNERRCQPLAHIAMP
jgi:hypothetical protein